MMLHDIIDHTHYQESLATIYPPLIRQIYWPMYVLQNMSTVKPLNL